MAEISSKSVDCIISMLDDFYKENKQLKSSLDYQREEARGYCERATQFKEELDKVKIENKELGDEIQELRKRIKTLES